MEPTSDNSELLVIEDRQIENSDSTTTRSSRDKPFFLQPLVYTRSISTVRTQSPRHASDHFVVQPIQIETSASPSIHPDPLNSNPSLTHIGLDIPSPHERPQSPLFSPHFLQRCPEQSPLSPTMGIALVPQDSDQYLGMTPMQRFEADFTDYQHFVASQTMNPIPDSHLSAPESPNRLLHSKARSSIPPRESPPPSFLPTKNKTTNQRNAVIGIGSQFSDYSDEHKDISTLNFDGEVTG